MGIDNMDIQQHKCLNMHKNLYEKRKLITYPRTDSRFLSDDMKDTVIKTMYTINVMPYSKAIAPLMNGAKLQLKFTKRIINNSKINRSPCHYSNE